MNIFKEVAIYSFTDIKTKHSITIRTLFNNPDLMTFLYKIRDTNKTDRQIFYSLNKYFSTLPTSPISNSIRVHKPEDFKRLSYTAINHQDYTELLNRIDLTNTFIYISNNKYLLTSLYCGYTIPVNPSNIDKYPILWFAKLYANAFYDVFVNKVDVKLYLNNNYVNRNSQ